MYRSPLRCSGSSRGVCYCLFADLATVVREADIVVAAVGRPELVRGAWIKPDAVVIDAGYNPGNVGDVE